MFSVFCRSFRIIGDTVADKYINVFFSAVSKINKLNCEDRNLKTSQNLGK